MPVVWHDVRRARAEVQQPEPRSLAYRIKFNLAQVVHDTVQCVLHTAGMLLAQSRKQGSYVTFTMASLQDSDTV
eukprot:753605-Hanusia_phi.AAC.2